MRRTLSSAALVLALALIACASGPSRKDLEASRIRYDLGVQAIQDGNIQEALKELQQAVEANPKFAKGYNALGLLYHLSLGRREKAEKAYLKALEIKPDFSEAANNLGALYLDMGRWADAEKLFRQVLDDVLYPTPHLARGNLGWALYKEGRTEEAITELKSAVLTQPKFCQGYRNLGLVYRETDRPKEATEAFSKYVKRCPDQPEAQLQWGLDRLLAGDGEAARGAFDKCIHLSGDSPVAERCVRELNALGGAAGDGGGAAE